MKKSCKQKSPEEKGNQNSRLDLFKRNKKAVIDNHREND